MLRLPPQSAWTLTNLCIVLCSSASVLFFFFFFWCAKMGMAALSHAPLDELAISGVRTYCNGRGFPLAVPFPNTCVHLHWSVKMMKREISPIILLA